MGRLLEHIRQITNRDNVPYNHAVDEYRNAICERAAASQWRCSSPHSVPPPTSDEATVSHQLACQAPVAGEGRYSTSCYVHSGRDGGNCRLLDTSFEGGGYAQR